MARRTAKRVSLSRLREQWLCLILIVPYWPSGPWMMDLTCLLHSPAVDTAFAQGPGVTEQLAETGT